MISVCMATYNGMPFLPEQVDSILRQIGSDDELVVSDDGSSDRTIEWLLDLRDDRIKLLNNRSRKGPVGNFQNALYSARGDFIFLSDQDDVWKSNKVQRTLELLDKNILVVSDCEVVGENGVVLEESFFGSRNSGPGIIRNLWKNSYVGSCMAFRKELLDVALPFPDTIHMHDWWLGLTAELVGNIAFLSEPLIEYRRHQHNASETWTGARNSIVERIKRRVSVGLPLAERLVRIKLKRN